MDTTLHRNSPSNAQTQTRSLLPLDTFSALDQCSVCHADIFDQWNRSAHRFSSMDNMLYAPSFEAARRARSVPGTRFCGGCHDPALLFAGDIDGAPITAAHERASLGVGCVLCHSVDHLHDRTGNGGYVLRTDPITATIPERTEDGHFINVLAHRRRVASESLRSADLCGACHKVALTELVTFGPWLRGQNELDPWEQSAFNDNDPSRYDPDVRRQTCNDCHMPREPATHGDVAAHNGTVRSHRFLGGHTTLAAIQHDDDTLARQRAVLEGAIAIDVLMTTAQLVDTPTAPQPFAAARVRAGQPLRLEIVLSNERVGHHFPAGTADATDVWIALTLRDANGRAVLVSGALDARGRLDPEAHRLHTRPLDANGLPAELRDPHRFRAQAYDTTLPPRASRVVRFQGDVPPDARAPFSLTAQVLHRRIADPYWAFVCAEQLRTTHRPCPTRPITTVAAFDEHTPRPLWRRYYDHGRALAEVQIQERVGEALASLRESQRLAGTHAGPWIELARVAIRQGRNPEAFELLARAEQIDPSSQVPDYFRALANTQVFRAAESITALSRVLTRYPRHLQTTEMLANALGLAGRHPEALSLLFSGLNIDPERAPMLNLLALELDALGAPDESNLAREAYERHRFHDGIPAIRTRCKREVPHCQRESESVHTHPWGPPLGSVTTAP